MTLPHTVHAIAIPLLLAACPSGELATPAAPPEDTTAPLDDSTHRNDNGEPPDTTDAQAATDLYPASDTPEAPDLAARPDAPEPQAVFCPPLAAAPAATVNLSPGDDLASMIHDAPGGTTVLLADGEYDVAAAPIWINTEGVTLRSASGDAAAVVLDGGYADNGSGEVIGIAASDVTIADITITRSRYHAIHVTGGIGPTTGTIIYNVVITDPGEQAIKVNRDGGGDPADEGLVACSTIAMTAAGRAQVESQTSSGSTCYTGGIDAHAARDWVVRDNTISGFWCSVDISEHAIHFWRGSRDTLVERNLLVNNARGVGFGLTLGGGRTYSDDPCGGERDHYGGVVRNNIIIGTDPALFASNVGMDGGVAFAHACDATAIHNTIASTQAPFASIEWRFPGTNALVVNNLATGTLRERGGATAVRAGNIAEIGTDWFQDLGQADGHLGAGGAGAIDAGAVGYESLAPHDVDGDPRDPSPDVGADEVM